VAGVATLGLVASLWLTGCGRIGFDALGADSVVPADAAFATPQLVQTQLNGGTGTSIGVVVTATTANSLVVVATGSWGPSSTIAGVSDDAGNIYVSANARATTGAGAGEIWYASNAAAGATTITVTWISSTNTEAWVAEVSAMDPTPLDTVAVQSDGVITNPVSAPTVTTTAPAFVVTMLGGVSSVGAIHAPFTAMPTLYGDDMAYTIATAAGAYGATWDDANVGAYHASTAAFKAAQL
jgi:hypothetical protein